MRKRDTFTAAVACPPPAPVLDPRFFRVRPLGNRPALAGRTNPRRKSASPSSGAWAKKAYLRGRPAHTDETTTLVSATARRRVKPAATPTTSRSVVTAFFQRLCAALRVKLPAAAMAVLLVGVGASVARGHATDESYIWLNAQRDSFDGRVELRLADLRNYLDLEIPSDYQAAREAVDQHSETLKAYVHQHFQIDNVDGQAIPYEIERVDLLENDYYGHFAQFFFRTAPLETPSRIFVRSDLLFEHDKFSRCLLCMEYNHFTGESFEESFHHTIFSPHNDRQLVDFNEIVPVPMGRKYFVWEGIRHIWIGIDHILFLVTLLLASVLVRREVVDEAPTEQTQLLNRRQEWLPVEGFRGAFWSIFKIVTIFTIAHSVTLCLASLDVITLPARLVESVIALSIIVVAVNNIFPTFRDRTWVILFLFGLFHGLGFASVMQNLPFRMSNLKRLLFCFNVGVEIGQLAIVAAVFPLIFLLRKSKYYQPVMLVGGSAMICAIAGYWFIERAWGSS